MPSMSIPTDCSMPWTRGTARCWSSVPRSRPGCDDKMTRIAHHLVFAVALALACRAQPQIAPGPLSRAHPQLDGITKCGSCHDFGASSRGFKCLECHAEIRRRVEAKTGFHGRSYKSSAGETDCRRCHAEHRGQATPLIRLDRQQFDHLAQTGFELV